VATQPTDPSILFPCSLRHDPTLQHFRLLNVTTTVTRIISPRADTCATPTPVTTCLTYITMATPRN
jgi:hypothetical protein